MPAFRSSLFGVLVASLASPLLASEPNFQDLHTVIEFDQYNVALNMLAVDGNLIIADSIKNVIAVRGIANRSRRDIMTSQQPSFLLRLHRNLVAVTDPSENQLTIFNWQTGSETFRKQYTQPNSPWHMTFHNGIIYGANRFDRLIMRFVVDSKKELRPLPSGSGTTFMHLRGSSLYVLEEGAPGNPADDYLAHYDNNYGTLRSRKKIDGALRGATIYNRDHLCMAVDIANYILCLNTEKREWQSAPTHPSPARLVEANGDLWVIARGLQNRDDDVRLEQFRFVEGSLKRIASHDLAILPTLKNARDIAFDATTKSLLVRGNTNVIAIPLVD